MSQQEQYWTTKQIAERANASVDCVKKWYGRTAGQGPRLRRTKIGGLTRVSEADFLEFISQSTAAAVKKGRLRNGSGPDCDSQRTHPDYSARR